MVWEEIRPRLPVTNPVFGGFVSGELQQGNFASAALLSRSVMETSAMLVLFSRNLTKAAKKIEPERVRAVVFSHYLGSKAFELAGSAKAPHVWTRCEPPRSRTNGWNPCMPCFPMLLTLIGLVRRRCFWTM
jgi:hypothetical protein